MSVDKELAQLKLAVIESSEAGFEWNASEWVLHFEELPWRSRKEKTDSRNIENPRDLVFVYIGDILVRKGDVTMEEDDEVYDASFLKSLLKFADLQAVLDESWWVSYTNQEMTFSVGPYDAEQENPTATLIALSQDQEFIEYLSSKH